uniref:Putative secreted protein n=1 Tax=Ixodes ricinus TaxID=34613 RepID=A0A6B0UEV8_IXORI
MCPLPFRSPRVSLDPVSLMSAIMTLAPSRASTWQTLRPIPLAPPVTIATLPSSRRFGTRFTLLTPSSAKASVSDTFPSVINTSHKQHKSKYPITWLRKGK